MPSDTPKTNAMRALEGKRIAFSVHTFPSSIHSADGVADYLGIPAGQVYKTLVVMLPKGRAMLIIVPGDRELDLKKLANVLDEKKIRMATQVEAEALTGLQVGGISALALLNKGFKVVLDESSKHYDEIVVSAGQRGINLQLTVRDLVKMTHARIADVAAAPEATA